MDYISKIEGHPIKAECLKESPRLTNSTPYLFRPSYSNGYGYETLIGGTCGVNQLFNFTGATTTINGITFTVNADNGITLSGTASDTANISINAGTSIINGHKYFISGGYDNNIRITNTMTSALTLNTSASIKACDYTTNYADFSLTVSNGTAILTPITVYPMLIDLTQMFGTSIADYVYTLETNTSGAGITWLKNNGFFTKPYYPYNAGGLLSVKTSKKVNTGKNQLNYDAWKNLGVNGGTAVYENNGVTITALTNDAYTFWTSDVFPQGARTSINEGETITLSWNEPTNKSGLVYIFPNGEPNGLVAESNTVAKKISYTATEGVTFVTFRFGVDNQGDTIAYKNIQIEFGSTATAYEPYVSHEYPLDDIELRGILKLDDNNNLYYDGDTYESNGSVTRKYGIVDLGTLSWVKVTNAHGDFFSALLGANPHSVANAQCLCALYQTSTAWYIANTDIDKAIGVEDTYMYIRDSAYNDATSFTNALNGVYLIYELATPTTETADPFTNPMIVDGNGTEEFVDTRAVQMPVGHSTIYVDNSDKTKLDNLPDISDSGDGKYLIKQENGKQSLVTPNATDISYSNTSSGLTATKIQGAIDEVNTKVGTKANSSDVYTKSNTYNKTEVNSMLTLVKTANGNPCTFTTDLADALVSLTANLVCGGGGGAPSTPIPLVGHTELNLTRCGVNFLDNTNFTTGLPNTAIGSQIDDIISTSRYAYFGITSPKQNVAITASTTSDDYFDEFYVLGYSGGLLAYNSGRYNITSSAVIEDLSSYDYIRVVIGSNGNNPVPLDLTGKGTIQLELGSTATAYAPYNGQTFTVAFGQTVYGGVYDKSGRLTITHGIVDLGTLDYAYYGGRFNTTGPIADLGGELSGDYYVNVKCDSYIKSAGGENDTFFVYSNKYVYLYNSDYTDAAAFKTSLSGVMLAYELATPIVIDVTAISVFAENGTNNIVSDCGGDIAVEYEVGDLANDVKTVISNTKFTDLSDIPNPPTTDGNYRLIVTITDGKPAYSWEEITE